MLKNLIKMETKTNKINLILNILLIVAGCIAAFSTLIPNDYLKLTVVLVCLCAGLYRILKSLSQSDDNEDGLENK
jgi:uncharacterized membrane protein YfcA